MKSLMISLQMHMLYKGYHAKQVSSLQRKGHEGVVVFCLNGLVIFIKWKDTGLMTFKDQGHARVHEI